MKYSVIVRYFGGNVTGLIVKADSVSEAWEKIFREVTLDHAQAVDIAELVAADYEIE